MKDELPLIGQAAIPVAQHRCAYRAGGARQRDDVHLCPGIHNHLLARRHAVNGRDLIPQQGGCFKIQPVRRRLHLLFQLLDDIFFAVPDHAQGTLHRFVIGFAGDFAAAHGHALADMGIQAGAALADITRELFIAAGQQKTVLGSFHHLPHRKSRGERADIIGVLIVLLQGSRNTRPGAVGDLYIAVALIIFEQDIILWRMGLNLAGFQHQGLKFALADDDIERKCVVDHLGDLRVMGHALAEIL